MTKQPRRSFQQRLLGGFDRSRLRHELWKAKGTCARRRYATLALGASMAVGGVGLPLTIAHVDAADPGAIVSFQDERMPQMVPGLGGPVGSLVEPTKDLSLITEKVREDFFRSEVPFGSLIYKEAKANDLDPELLAAVVQTESQFKPTAKSQRGAVGLMQLIPRTARWMGAKNPQNPADNVKAGAKYLRYLHDRFDGDQKKVLAAYNAGEGNVRKYGGVPPFRETRNYVKRVQRHEADFKKEVTGKVAEVVDDAGGLAITR